MLEKNFKRHKQVKLILILILLITLTSTSVNALSGIQPPKSKGIQLQDNREDSTCIASKWSKPPKDYWKIEVQFKNCKTGKVKTAIMYGGYTAYDGRYKKGKKSYKVKTRARYITRCKHGRIQTTSQWSSWSQTILIPKKGR